MTVVVVLQCLVVAYIATRTKEELYVITEIIELLWQLFTRKYIDRPFLFLKYRWKCFLIVVSEIQLVYLEYQLKKRFEQLERQTSR